MITTLEMKILETNSTALGVSTTLLMEAAGSRVADFVDSKLKGRIGSSIVVMVGKGGNGGDGLVAARYLSSKGYPVEVLLAFPHQRSSIRTPCSTSKLLRRSKA